MDNFIPPLLSNFRPPVTEEVSERTMKRRERSMIRSLEKAGYSVVKAEAA